MQYKMCEIITKFKTYVTMIACYLLLFSPVVVVVVEAVLTAVLFPWLYFVCIFCNRGLQKNCKPHFL